MTTAHVEEYKGYNIEIHYDDNAENPNDAMEMFGHLISWHSRYAIGEKHDYAGPDELYAEIKPSDVVLPVYLYDHSGLRLSTGSFNDPWDSGQIGYIVAWADDIRRNYGVKRISKRIREKVINALAAEVEIWDAYLSGEVYGYVVLDNNGEHVDSCWGFYGDMDYMISEAKAAVDYETREVA